MPLFIFMKDLLKEFISMLKAGFDDFIDNLPLIILAFVEALWMIGMCFVLLEF